MNRRRTLSMLSAALCAPATFARAADKVRHVGVAYFRIARTDLEGPNPTHRGANALRKALASAGWVDGRNVQFTWRSAEGDVNRVQAIVRDLVQARVDVMVLSGNHIIREAMRQAPSTPIVMLVSLKPVEEGFVKSLARPGGNVTGTLADATDDLNGKRLAMLHQMAPRASRVGFLTDSKINSMTGGLTASTQQAARSLNLTLIKLKVDEVTEVEPAIEQAVREGARALFVDTSVSAAREGQAVFQRATEARRLPAMHTYSNAVRGGGLMFYGPDTDKVYQRISVFVDRILRGANPATMPVEQPDTMTLIINKKAARTIGIDIPPTLLAQADEVLDQ